MLDKSLLHELLLTHWDIISAGTVPFLFFFCLFCLFFFQHLKLLSKFEIVLDRPVKMSEKQSWLLGLIPTFQDFLVDFVYIDIFIYSAFNIFDHLDR